MKVNVLWRLIGVNGEKAVPSSGSWSVIVIFGGSVC
jgi:hypothetical protein